MDQNIKKYLEYARSPEAYAVLFVKKYLRKASDKFWIDILSFDAPAGYDFTRLVFKSVTCELFPRWTAPDYPPAKAFPTEHDHIMACRAATWEAAAHDIHALRVNGYRGARYRINCVSFPRHKDIIRSEAPDPATFFTDDAPPEIKALADNLNDRTDPLWDEAVKYIRKSDCPDDDYEFQIKRITRIR